MIFGVYSGVYELVMIFRVHSGVYDRKLSLHLLPVVYSGVYELVMIFRYIVVYMS